MKFLLAFVAGGLTIWVMLGLLSPKVHTPLPEKVSEPIVVEPAKASEPVAVERAPTLAEQAACAQQARAEFARGGWKVGAFTNFTDHFNPKLGKCFYEVVDTTPLSKTTPSSSRMVGDAFEGTVYAKYLSVNTEGKKYWEVSPSECSVDGVTCKSLTEFDELVEAHFGLETDR